MGARLGLGTAQFGMPYGVVNTDGRPSAETVRDILSAAQAAGVAFLDTAAAYGDSESVLGANDLAGFRVVTKVPRIGSPDDAAAALTAAFDRSLERLRLDRVDALLMHDADDLLGGAGEALMAALRRLRAAGRVGRIGASLYEPAQADALLARFDDIDLMQVPINVVDQRLIEGGQLARMAARGVSVHARSAFLQGLLLVAPEELPGRLTRFRPVLQRWHDAVARAGSTPIAAALAFVRDLPGVEAVIVGVATLAQILGCTAAFAGTERFDGRGLGCGDEVLIDPRRWAAA